MEGNLLVVHGGGPTAVLNASLYGVIREAQKNPDIKKIYGAIGGSEAILTENFLDMGELEDEKIELLLQTPGTAIGSSRFPLEQEQYEAMVDILKKNDIKYVLFNGGNGSMDTCGKVSKVCADEGIYVVGIPKTMDNDISIIDHAPGFPSAAKYIATVTKEVGADVKSLPIHVCVIEAMGRNAGWITAASVLARKEPGDAPHLVYLPERNFKEEEFLEDVKRLYDELGGVVVVVSEGLRNEEGDYVTNTLKDRAVDAFGHKILAGASRFLEEILRQEIGCKVRSIELNVMQRCASHLASAADIHEARLIGMAAADYAISGGSGKMACLQRVSTNPYRFTVDFVDITKIANRVKTVPEEWINEAGNDVTQEMIDYLLPLIQGEMPCTYKNGVPVHLRLY